MCGKLSPLFLGDLGVLVKGGCLGMHVLPHKLILPMPPRLVSNQKSHALKTLPVLGAYDKVCEDLVLQSITSDTGSCFQVGRLIDTRLRATTLQMDLNFFLAESGYVGIPVI